MKAAAYVTERTGTNMVTALEMVFPDQWIGRDGKQ
jgi:hypothetical protein